MRMQKARYVVKRIEVQADDSESIIDKKEYAITELFRGSKKIEEVRKEVSDLFDLYAPVAKVYTDDIEEVFALGNFEVEDVDWKFIRLAERMRSVSVGDIVYDSLLNSYFMVDPSGWARVEEPESTRKHFNDVEAAE